MACTTSSVGARLAGANAIGLARLALDDNLDERHAMVLDKTPVVLVGAVAIDLLGLAFQRVRDDERDQLFGELPDAVVVGRGRVESRQTVVVILGTDQMVGGGLGGGIESARSVGRMFVEGWVDALLHRAENLVGRDVVEAEALLVIRERRVIAPNGLQESEGSHEVARTVDRAIDMAFDGEMHDRIRLVGGKDFGMATVSAMSARDSTCRSLVRASFKASSDAV
jgi:hypothetical protein